MAAKVSRVIKAMDRAAARPVPDLRSSMVRTKPFAHVAVHLDHEAPTLALSDRDRFRGRAWFTFRVPKTTSTPCLQHSALRPLGALPRPECTANYRAGAGAASAG